MTYKFDGHWEFELELPSFAPYTNRYRTEAGNEPVDIYIQDDEWEDPNPLPQQIAAIHYLISNQEQIVTSISRALVEAYKPFRKEAFEEEYYSEEEFTYEDTFDPEDQDEDLRERYPLIKLPEEAHLVAGIGSITICGDHKEGFAYMIFRGSCNWDDEHGHSFVMHKDRIVELTGYDYDGWSIERDQGIDIEKLQAEQKAKWQEREQAILNGGLKPKEPVIQKPHPIFGTYREWQRDSNAKYWMNHLQFFGEENFLHWYKNPPKDFPAEFLPLPTLVAQHAAKHGHEKLLNYCLKQNKSELNGILIEAIKGRQKKIAINLLQLGARFSQNKNDHPFYILFSQLSIVKSDITADNRGKQILEMIEWVYSLGERPVDLPDTNAFRSMNKFSEENAKILCDSLGKLAKKFTQISHNADINTALKKETLFHRAIELDNALNKLSYQWNKTDSEFICAHYLLMEGIIPKTKYVSANYSLPDKSNGPHITLVQEFVRERLIAHNPVLSGALNKPAVAQATREERIVVAEAIVSHYKKEEVKSWAKFFFKFLKIFMR